jgi:hypothetical protein
MSQPITPAGYHALAPKLISDPRLAPYRSQFRTQTDVDAVGIYMWAQAVSASLHPFLGLAEVVLRNAIHRSLSVQCSAGTSDSFAWYDRASPSCIPLHGKSLDRVESLLSKGTPPLRKAIQPSPDAVVAGLSFGFWPNVMEGLSHRYGPRTFTDVFAEHPHSRPAHWSRLANKTSVVLRLKRLQDLRNRVCHFEPVWKPHWLGLQTPCNWSRAVTGLRALHSELVELVGWCSGDAVTIYKNTFGWNWFNTLCTTRAATAFMAANGNVAHLPSFAPPFSPSTVATSGI